MKNPTSRSSPIPRAAAILFLASAVSPALPGQERVHEHVEVIHQEVLVRVFDGGRPVPGLKSGDFTLFENGRKVRVDYCRELRRALARPESEAAGPAAGPARPRLFLFMLWFNEESREWPRAWEYFLTHVYRRGDRIVLSDGRRAMEVSSPEGDAERIAAYFAGMAEALKQKKLAKARLVAELERSTSDFYDDLVSTPATNAGERLSNEKTFLERFKSSYLGALNEYRLERLKGYPRWLERLAGALKPVAAEKWALVFLQNERLPLLHRDARLLREAPMSQATLAELVRFMEESERQVQLASEVMNYLRELRPLFVGANATYHVFLSDAAGEMLSNEHLWWKPVFSSWEGAFRQISADTGGGVSNTTRLEEALQKAAEREDVYYVLTYKPADQGPRRRELRVEVKRPGLKAVYSRTLTLGELFPLKISRLEWREGRLVVTLADFQRMFGDSGLSGRLRLAVRALADGGEPLAAEREVLPADPAVDVEMTLTFPAPGRYSLQVEAEDLLSGNKAHAEKEIEVPPPAAAPAPESMSAGGSMPPELGAALEKAAGYCRRLKEGAFRFYCLEKVEERGLERNPLIQGVESVARRWHYDYQITGANGVIRERRRLVLDGTRKVSRENASLETRFSSLYSVFLPVTLLAVENRSRYRYRLQGSEKLNGRQCLVVEITPIAEQAAMAQGLAWIDAADGSVIRIKMSPRGVAGVEALEESARRMSAVLVLEVTHRYQVEHGGLRFPSATEFIEQYRFDKSLATLPKIDVRGAHPATTVLESRVRFVEFYRLRQDYEDYRFFEVESREEILPPPLS